MKILIVEDDYSNQMVLQSILAQYGKVVIAGDGKLAIKKVLFESGGFDALFIDIGLPYINGNDLISMIRKWEQEQKKTPHIIVVTSGRGSKKDILDSFKSGCNFYLTKPFLLSEVEGFMKEAGFAIQASYATEKS
ncbi:MAG: response regulator [SAR324 cluster bacterium]|nr:response regulator [SAR324 cluster bacterium]